MDEAQGANKRNLEAFVAVYGEMPIQADLSLTSVTNHAASLKNETAKNVFSYYFVVCCGVRVRVLA